MEGPDRQVSAALVVDSSRGCEALLQIAVPNPVTETLSLQGDGGPLEATEIATPGGRVHRVRLPAGATTITYSARVAAGSPRPVTAAERLQAVRPSRYCPSDRLEAFVRQEFAGLDSDPSSVLLSVADWVARRLRYVVGSSRVSDDAITTMLAGQGVCRDYAHLTIALLRAMEVPARLVAAYAPGLYPMDFHAVVEVDIDGVWQAVDVTRLAPVASMVRIHHGQDAADTAFLSLFGGAAELTSIAVIATVDGDLPAEDGKTPLPIA